eukprot:4590299-Pleurochrysis_carterae.AAC.1
MAPPRQCISRFPTRRFAAQVRKAAAQALMSLTVSNDCKVAAVELKAVKVNCSVATSGLGG